MNQRSLSNRLKAIIIGIGICGLILACIVLPYGGSKLTDVYDIKYWLYLIFIWVALIPCYAALMYAWRIAVNIGNNRSFSLDNAILLKKISNLAVIDSTYIFVGSVTLLLSPYASAEFFLFTLIIVFAGISLAIAASALSHLVTKAAELQDESDLTI